MRAPLGGPGIKNSTKGGDGGKTECSGNGAPSICCGWYRPGELGAVGGRSGVDAMGLAHAWGSGSDLRHYWLLSVARFIWDKRLESELNALPACGRRIFPFLRTP